MDCEQKCKILIFGATGYLGRFMAKASMSMGHSTYAYVRPLKPGASPAKLEVHRELESIGVTVFQGELDDHEKLVWAIKQAEIVISTLAVPQHLEQLKIISAMKDAGTIKRFVPSEFGNEVDRVSGLPPFEALLENKRKVRRATEAAGLDFTYVSANSFAAYFVDYLLHPHNQADEAAVDPRVRNRVIIFRPPGNIVSQLDLISMWEKKTGRTLKRVHTPEDEVVKLSESLPFPENIPVAILHNIFIKGDQTSFEITEKDLEASQLYPDHKYTSVDDLLEICLVNPPKPKLADFA
ncbi:NmrA-like domain [Dillenia turbinata]|uniref:NmrA-like domain n=1 Tax=Dillenia turbinata TaxID=194707 RepID=A0AAN8UT50_9MAGN